MTSPRPGGVRRRPSPAFLAALLLGLAGCGSSKTYPVEGKLVWEDGSPV